MDQVVWRRPRAFFFCIDPSGVLNNTGSRRRNDIRKLLEVARSYEDAVRLDPDTVARGRHVIIDHFRFIAKGQHRDSTRTCYWIFGGTGLGKSRLAEGIARDKYGSDYFIHPPGSLKWWGSYEEQPCVILDDIRRSDVFAAGGFNYLLKVLDRYDVEVEIKGGFRTGRWETVIITCCNAPDAEFTYHRDGESVVEENLGQLIRRLDKIIELRVLGDSVQEVDHTAFFRQQYHLDGFKPLAESAVFGIKLGGDTME